MFAFPGAAAFGAMEKLLLVVLEKFPMQHNRTPFAFYRGPDGFQVVMMPGGDGLPGRRLALGLDVTVGFRFFDELFDDRVDADCRVGFNGFARLLFGRTVGIVVLVVCYGLCFFLGTRFRAVLLCPLVRLGITADGVPEEAAGAV